MFRKRVRKSPWRWCNPAGAKSAAAQCRDVDVDMGRIFQLLKIGIGPNEGWALQGKMGFTTTQTSGYGGATFSVS